MRAISHRSVPMPWIMAGSARAFRDGGGQVGAHGGGIASISSASPIGAWPIDTSCKPGTSRTRGGQGCQVEVMAGVDAQSLGQGGLGGGHEGGEHLRLAGVPEGARV